jgi:type II secretory pathway component PulL
MEMINLLPPTQRHEIQAGRVNALLVRYLILMGCVLMAVLGIFAFSYMSLQTIKATDQAKIDDNQASFAALKPAETEINDFRSNLATAQQILSKQIDYTYAIARIASVTKANGVVLNDLKLDAASFGKPITLSIRAKNEQAIFSTKAAFNNQTQYFGNANFSTVTFNPEEKNDFKYTATINVTLKPEIVKL